ncbi:RBBP9/YdeN family alpha/beta hydrolase [Sphingomonas sp. MMS24-JH45]
MSAARAPVILVGAQPRLCRGGVVGLAQPSAHGWPVAGALLVAPADVDAPGVAAELAPFAPAPRAPLPFPSIVVASGDDPWIHIDRAHSLAVDWGSHFVDAGFHGHLNAASGLGCGPRGWSCSTASSTPVRGHRARRAAPATRARSFRCRARTTPPAPTCRRAYAWRNFRMKPISPV